MGVFRKTAESEQHHENVVPAKDLEKNYEDVRLEQRQNSIDAATIPVIDPVVEKRVVRKLDWNLVPLLMALYLLAFLDRSNIGMLSKSTNKKKNRN